MPAAEEEKDGPVEVVAQQPSQRQPATNDEDTDGGDKTVESAADADGGGAVKPAEVLETLLPQSRELMEESEPADDSLASLSESTATLQKMFEQERERLRAEQAGAAAALDQPGAASGAAVSAAAATDALAAAGGVSVSSAVSSKASPVTAAAPVTAPAVPLDLDSTSIVIPPLSSIASAATAYNPMGLPALAPAAPPKADMGLGLGAISWDEARRPFALQQPTVGLSGSGELAGSAAQPFPGMGSSLGLGLGGLTVGSGVGGSSAIGGGRSLSDSELSWGLGRSMGSGQQRADDVGIGLHSGNLVWLVGLELAVTYEWQDWVSGVTAVMQAGVSQQGCQVSTTDKALRRACTSQRLARGLRWVRAGSGRTASLVELMLALSRVCQALTRVCRLQSRWVCLATPPLKSCEPQLSLE